MFSDITLSHKVPQIAYWVNYLLSQILLLHKEKRTLKIKLKMWLKALNSKFGTCLVCNKCWKNGLWYLVCFKAEDGVTLRIIWKILVTFFWGYHVIQIQSRKELASLSEKTNKQKQQQKSHWGLSEERLRSVWNFPKGSSLCRDFPSGMTMVLNGTDKGPECSYCRCICQILWLVEHLNPSLF